MTTKSGPTSGRAPARPPVRPPSPSRVQGPGWKEWAGVLCVAIASGCFLGMLVGQAMEAPPVAVAEGPRGDAAALAPAPVATRAAGLSLLPTLEQPMNLLVMGTDVQWTRNKAGKRVQGLNGNTDTMILVRLDPAQDRVRMLSIPRDTRVPIPGHGTFKINAANPFGGPKLAVKTVERFLDLPIHHYLLINTQAVIQIVDALGGVHMYVPKRLYYNDFSQNLHINLGKGWNDLTGKQAHDFVRFRHDELGDIGRVQRQQMFMQALLSQYLTPGNLLKTPKLLSIASANLETDLGTGDLLRCVTWGKDLKKEKVSLAMVPGTAQTIGGLSYWVADERANRRIVGGFLTGEATQEARKPSQYRVAVRDGMGDARVSTQVRRYLAGAGYGAYGDGANAQLGQKETLVIAQQADLAGAQALVASLGVGKVVAASTGDINSDYTVVVGADWAQRKGPPLPEKALVADAPAAVATAEPPLRVAAVPRFQQILPRRSRHRHPVAQPLPVQRPAASFGAPPADPFTAIPQDPFPAVDPFSTHDTQGTHDGAPPAQAVQPVQAAPRRHHARGAVAIPFLRQAPPVIEHVDPPARELPAPAQDPPTLPESAPAQEIPGDPAP